MFRFFPILFLLLVGPGSLANAQYRGVVWSEPVESHSAAADLHAMASMGIDAVRTAPLRNQALYALADTLGIALFQELPLAFVPAARLADTLEAVGAQLSLLLDRSEGHRSARHFGLGYGLGTDRPEACEFLQRLDARFRRSDQQFYYVSLLPTRERCAESGQMILLDGGGHENPLGLLKAWRGGNAGLAAVGVPVDPEATDGLLVPGSSARQALFFEDTLPALQGRTAFAYRWKDEGLFQQAPLGRLYGLHDAMGAARAAARVIAGVYTGGQTYFAYPAGTPESSRRSWMVLVGWMFLLVVAATFAISSRFATMVPRYFLAHGFYRNAVNEGREGIMVATSLLLAVLGGTVGLMFTLGVEQFVETAPYAAVRHWIGAGGASLDRLATMPGLPVLLGGSAAILLLSLWVALWTLAVRRRKPLRAAQALMLAVWPQWTHLPLLVVTMIVSTLPPAETRTLVIGLLGCWLLAAAWGTVRTSLDLTRMIRVGPVAMGVLVLFNPFVLMAAAFGLALLTARPELGLLWSLAQAGW